MTKTSRLTVTALTAAIALGAAPAAAFASDSSHGGGGGVTRSGSCTGSTDWKLKAKADDGRLEVEFEVDSNQVGQTWQVRLTDNGSQFFAGTRRTVAPSGSFSVETRTANKAGTDRIVASATNAATGEVCRGALAI